MAYLRAGHVAALKSLIHLFAGGTFVYLVLLVMNDQMGGDPVQAIIHFTGKSTIHLLFLTLLVTPLAKWLKENSLYRVRRLLGLYCFAWATIHLLAFAVLDLTLEFSILGEEILKRPYLTLGMVGWLILLALAVTSTQGMQKRLGRRWNRLHSYVYLVALIAPLHYIWSVKSGLFEPIMYIVISILLLIYRKKKFSEMLYRGW